MEKWLNTFSLGLPVSFAGLLCFVFLSYLFGFLFLEKILRIKWRVSSFQKMAHLIAGIDIAAFLFFIFGCSGLIKSVFLWPLFIAGALSGVFVFLKNVKIKAKHLKSRSFIASSALLLTLLLLSSSSLTYPIGWDELTYHISVPLKWGKDSFPMFYADNPYSAFPSFAEFLFWPLIEMCGITTPKMLVWLTLALILFSLYLILRPKKAPFNAFSLCLALILCPLSMMFFRESYVEPFITLNLLGSIILAQGVRRKMRSNAFYPSHIAALSIMAGSALAVKMTGFSVGCAMFIIFTGLRKFDSGKIKAALIFAAATAAFALPFYLRGWILSGNPAYPYLSEFFTHSESALQTCHYHHAIGSFKYGTPDIYGFFTNPILIAFKGNLFDGSLGLQLLAFYFLCILTLRRFRENRNSLEFAAAALLIYVFWFFTARQARFIMPLFPLIIIIANQTLLKHPPGKRFALNLIIIILTLFSIPKKALLYYFNCWKATVGKVRTVDHVYTGTGDGYLQAIAIIKEKVPENAGLLMIFERRGLYMPGRYEIGTPYFQEKFFTPIPSKASDIEKKLRKENIEYVLIGTSKGHPDRLPEYEEKNLRFVYLIGNLIENKTLKPIWSGDGYMLLKLKKE